MESDLMSAGPEDPNMRRACDQCRTRKVRCDKNSPCSNCRTAMRTCSSIGAVPKPKEQRHRVLISHQYERKIDMIEERLSGIEDALRALASNGGASMTNFDHSRHNRHMTTPTSSGQFGDASHNNNNINNINNTKDEGVGDDDDDSAFEGELSLTAHTAFAHDFLENAVQRTSLNDMPANMQNALSSLREIVKLRNKASTSRELSFRHSQHMPPGGLAEMPMPPMSTVVSLLKHQKSAVPSVLSIGCSFLDIDDLAELCRRVYFCTEAFSHALFIIVNGSLYYLFMEQTAMAKDKAAAEEFESYRRICQVNLETALAAWPLMLPAKTETIEALLFAALYSIDVSKPSLAWHFCSTAATLCQTLGYHRLNLQKIEQPKGDASLGSRDIRPLLFWNVYVLDKDLALRTGRCSILQDWDITLPRTVDRTIVPDPWGPILTTWIREADLHQRIYHQLFSPVALAKPMSERVAAARKLELEQKEIMAVASQTREEALFGYKALSGSVLIDLHLRGDELSFYSTLVLIYRALPAPEGSPTRFTPECIDTSRLAMALHLECMQRLADEKQHLKTIYVHWAILSTPFAPFFVLFCHVIETSSVEDLRRLNSFVQSLTPAVALSEPVDKMQQLCQLLYNVAQFYVDAKSQQAADNAPINAEFDHYLRTLGFPASELQAQQGGGPGDPAGTPQSAMQMEQLGNWFAGNQQMMGLLEEDLSQLNQGGWMQ